MMSTILFTIDVEDWFQVENFKPYIPYSAWEKCELRVERNIHIILDLLDGIQLPGAFGSSKYGRKPKATFFILGWIAERLPGLVHEIAKRGHEVASHGFHHDLCSNLSNSALKNDLISSKKLLEDMVGQPVIGYRAPSFSIDNRILKLVNSSGYLYDASYNSFEMNRRYGKIDLDKTKKIGIAHEISDDFQEFPISNLKIFDHIIPFGGGGYFRLYPRFILNAGIKRILKSDQVYHFYIHPWEIDRGQPKVHHARFLSKFRHYINIGNNFDKLKKFLEEYRHCDFLSCRDYLSRINLQV